MLAIGRIPDPPPQTAALLYVPSGAVLQRLVLSYNALAADVYWIRAIQYLRRQARCAAARSEKHHYELLYPLLDIATTLDPHFNIAYRFGAVFLS